MVGAIPDLRYPGTFSSPSPSPLRAVYVLIFLVALLATYTIWAQAGGQAHLDLMPWYWKLFPPFAFSYAIGWAKATSGRLLP